jgi:cytochrome c-type biogenesis protein CcmF
LLVAFYPFTFYKHGNGFLGAIYVAAFATIYSCVANAFYIFKIQKGKFLKAGSPVAHAGFMLMLVGILISSANKEVISNSAANGIVQPTSGKDPMTKQQDNPNENLTLLRQVPATLGDYKATFINDSLGNEKGRKFYNIAFEKKNAQENNKERFILQPDVYMMKDNNMSSNPDTKSYLLKDVFTYVSYAINKTDLPEDTTSFREVILAVGDTTFYSNGYMVLNANITITAKDSMHYQARPMVIVDKLGVINIDDTIYAQNLYMRFTGVADTSRIKIGIKESDKFIEYITVKAYVFPLINLVWLGLVIMAIGLLLSMLQRGNFSKIQSASILLGATAFVFYMFLLAGG